MEMSSEENDREVFNWFAAALTASRIRADLSQTPNFVNQLATPSLFLSSPVQPTPQPDVPVDSEHTTTVDSASGTNTLVASTPSRDRRSKKRKAPESPRASGSDSQRAPQKPRSENSTVIRADPMELSDDEVLDWTSPARPQRQREPRVRDYQHTYSPAETDELDRSGAFRIPTAEDCDRVYTKCAQDLASHNELPCATCEMAFRPEDVETIPLSEELLTAMREHLTQPIVAGIPQFIIKQYDASEKDARLDGLLLYPPGVIVQSNGIVGLQLCTECRHSLENSHLPRMAIANGNWIGRFPQGELPWIEEQLIALVSPCVSIKTVTGGSQRCLRSHHYIVKNTAGPILEMLPDQAASRIRVTMVGAMTPQQIAICKRRHTVELPRAKEALRFLMENHKSYQSRYQEQDQLLSGLEGRLTDVVEDRTESSDDPARGAVVQRIDDTSSYAVPAVNEHQDDRAEDEWVEENSIILDQSEQSDDYLVRQSTAFLTSRQWENCIDMFPTLFPGGCGGPKEHRKKPLSVTAWARRVLRLHGCLFQRHDVFLLLVFDYLALENARSRMFFRLKATRDAIRAGSVTRETIAECVTYRQHLVQCQAIGVTPDPPSESIRQVINIQKGVEASEVAYYGSNRSRAQARSDLFGYIRRFGPLHVFFTVSPDASGVYSIGVQSGAVDANLIQAANAHMLPNKTERRKIATRHPVECAKYFMRVMDSIVSNVLGWDENDQAPRRGGGLFGIVKAYTAAAETQVSGDLHAHFVVWLHGLPATGSAMETKLQEDTDFVHRYLQLVDTVSTLSIPGFDTNCPECDSELTPLPFPLRAYQRQRKDGTGPVPTSTCKSCDQSFHSHDLLDAMIARDGELSPADKDFILCADPPLRQEDENQQHKTAVILRQVQTHYWHHTPSCFKVTKRTPTASVCRFLRPAPAQAEPTHIDASLDIHQHRPIGCEYLNAFNAVLARLFRCNHDVRFIINGSSRDVAAYICKYVMKSQNRIENDLAFRLASMERVSRNVDTRNATIELSARDRGNKILSGLIYAMTNRQEMPATMAALLVFRGSAFWTSHPVVSLNIPQLLSTLDNTDNDEEDVSIPVEYENRDTPVHHKPNTLRAYWNRPPHQEQLSLVEFVERFTITRDRLKPNDQWKVVCLRGTKMPNIEDCQDQVEREHYYKIMTLLFKPHREDTLRLHTGTFEYLFDEFVREGPRQAVELAVHYATNMNDSDRASGAAEAPSAEELLLSQHSALSGLSSAIDNLEDTLSDVEDDGVPDHFGLIDAIPDMNALHRLDRYDEELEQDPILADAIANFANESTTHPIASEGIEIEAQSAGSSTGTTTFLELFTTVPTRLEKLQECFSPVPWVDPDTSVRYPPDSLPRFAKIAEVSLSYQLNPWQHYAFETAARHVLYEYLKAIETAVGEPFPRPSQHSLKPQLVGFLGGEAGAGKSTVIHALLAFARSWERVGSIETLSFTGVAAISINGRTIHSSRNLSIVENDDRRPSAEMTAKFASVALTIIDEISMTDQRLLGRADAITRHMTNRDVPWGGHHVLLCGDWKQIPPVGGTPAFKPNSTSAFGDQGYELYSKINFVVFLIDNMRSRTDPIYTEILRRMRRGKLTSRDIETLNTRVGASCGPTDPSKGFFRPVVTGTNLLRCAVNYRTALEAGRSGRVQLFEAIAKPVSASLQNFAKFQDFDDHLTSRIPLKFLYYLGMPVMITHRVNDPALRDVAANGTIGHIIDHELKTTAFQVTSVDGVSVFRHPQLPRRLFVRVKDCHVVLSDGLPPGVIPIEPLHIRLSIDVPGPRHRVRKSAKPTMTVDQFPMVPAFACTPEKLQGQTCKDGIILTKLTRGAKSLSPEALYVAFSRTVSLSKLSLTHPIHEPDAATCFKPTAAIVQEMNRLQMEILVPEYFSASIVDTFNAWLSLQLSQ